ncbi:MAG: high-affinity iron transporter [Thermoplasmata archaeon]|jgi:high-affinity iron transporter|nr:high-affinity iron transporter [Thermoplasmata archaeon]
MASVDPAAALIGLREGLEALLVLGILLGLVRRFGHPEKQALLWMGAGAGVVASIVVGLLVARFAMGWFEDAGGAALFEVVVALTAVGILTYMIVWMQQHTTELLGKAKRAVQDAATGGRWMVLAALTFVTVFREGLETVLFYAARSSAVSWGDLLLSGAVGFGASALIAALVFGFTVKVDLRKFFGVTGAFLILIAAGLLIHVVHAAADLGWIPHGAALWDTSGALPDHDHWLGGPLHALIGYEDQPTALGLLLYLGYIVGVGGWYLSRIVAKERRAAARATSAAVFVALLAAFAFTGALPTGAGDHGHGHDDDRSRDADEAVASQLAQAAGAALARIEAEGLRVGVLVRAHGEPVHYNATTYASFKAFVDGVWPYTGLPPEMLLVDQGTILLDDAHPFATTPQADASFVDAWLRSYTLPAIPVTDPAGAADVDEELAGGQFYLAPGAGPGLGEGDVYEVLGLGTYRTWLKMENASPMHGAVVTAWDSVERQAQAVWGDRVVVAFAHHVDPKMDPTKTIEAAARTLADAGVDLVIDAYMSSVHSDAMDTCMMRPHTEHALRAAGYTGPIVAAGMAGTTLAWAQATADRVVQLVAEAPAGAKVSVYLAQHGGDPASTNPCGEGADQYHANAAAEFALAQAAIAAELGGNVTVRQVYGQGASAAGGPLSPDEALALDRAAGVGHVVVLPYEFWGNAMDNLVPLRESFGYTADDLPYYGPGHETRLTRGGVDVRIASAEHGTDAKAGALLLRIAEAIAGEAAAGAPADHAHD